MIVLPPKLLSVLDQCQWVHALGMKPECEGCANDGEPGYCKGPGVGRLQDGSDEVWCHCGHAIVMVELPRGCECDGPPGWHCPGEDSGHWAEHPDDPNSPCGHCGGSPSDYDDEPTLEFLSIPEGGRELIPVSLDDMDGKWAD